MCVLPLQQLSLILISSKYVSQVFGETMKYNTVEYDYLATIVQ